MLIKYSESFLYYNRYFWNLFLLRISWNSIRLIKMILYVILLHNIQYMLKKRILTIKFYHKIYFRFILWFLFLFSVYSCYTSTMFDHVFFVWMPAIRIGIWTQGASWQLYRLVSLSTTKIWPVILEPPCLYWSSMVMTMTLRTLSSTLLGYTTTRVAELVYYIVQCIMVMVWYYTSKVQHRVQYTVV